MDKIFTEKMEALEEQMRKAEKEHKDRERLIRLEIRAAQEEKNKAIALEKQAVDRVNEELKEVMDTRDVALEEKYSLESKIEGQSGEIEELKLSLHRSKEDVSCRKMIIDDLSQAMLGHEKESAEMASKMTLLMNQIMENDKETGIKRKYTALRVGTIRNHPCVFYFVEGNAKNEFFMVIDEKATTKTINVEFVDQFCEDPAEKFRLSLTYHIMDEDDKMVKKKEEYECAETEYLLKTFKGIQNKIVGLGVVAEDFSTILGGRKTKKPAAAAADGEADSPALIEEESPTVTTSAAGDTQ